MAWRFPKLSLINVVVSKVCPLSNSLIVIHLHLTGCEE